MTFNETSLKLYITGASGTGKTSVAKRLSKLLNLEYIEVNEIILEKKAFLGYDIDRESLIIDDELLIPILNSIIKNSDKICLSGDILALENYFNYIIILHCKIDILRLRLAKRGYKKAKIESNIEVEIMNILYYDAVELFPNIPIIEVNNDINPIEETCKNIISKIR
ncbi:AAA family ATPase [Candidatus Hodarchaeum mangrovi]